MINLKRMVNKLFIVFFLLLITFFYPQTAFAKSNSFVSVVNPIRGEDFRQLQNQKVEEAVLGQIEILKHLKLPATWLIRFDALTNRNITETLISNINDEKGLFLEVTQSWAKEANVNYHQSKNWHDAGSAFLTGYEREERQKLIDVAFEKFKKTFGYYPVSVGAWWIDSFSLSYMQKKYGIIAALVVSDQYTTDNYQIWGQYFSTPYYPDKKNALHPAQSTPNKLPVVIMQWAPRDPVNAYGNGVMESTYSVQANDYTDYHDLNTDYFSSLVDLYTKQQFNQFNQIVVGLENSYLWSRYKDEYKNQMQTLSNKEKNNQIAVVNMKDFANWYKSTFPNLSPTQIIVADDPLGSYKKAVWFMNPYFRSAWFLNADGSVFRDIRQYIEGDEEICFQKRCDEVNFATFATRVLDEVSFGHKWVIDEGKISDFGVEKNGDNFIITYLNEAGNLRTIEFLPRDISVNGKISSIDGAILDAIKIDLAGPKKTNDFQEGGFSWSIVGVISKTVKFILFLAFAVFVPGYTLTNVLGKSLTQKIFLANVTGLVFLTLVFYTSSLLNTKFLTFVYVLFALLLFVRLKLFSQLKFKLHPWDKLTLLTVLVVVAGTIFQNIPMFRNGLVYPFGMGFWGPNTHDGIWHFSLINQLIKGLPTENPIFAGTDLKNYHFFYDLLVAATVFLTKIPILDLIFRFYPILFSLSLGLGTYVLATALFKKRLATIFSLYFVYFAGSFGWIVDYIKNKSFGGESAFWANQSISFNLNPPFAISLLIIVAFLLLLLNSKSLNTFNKILISVLLVGSLVGFKSYGSVLTLATLFVITIVNIFKRDFSYLMIFVCSTALTLLIFFSNFTVNQQLILFSPFWLIHSMVDSPDRLGWARLSFARVTGLETKNWVKLVSAEIIGLLIFILGNLGLRFLSIFPLFKIKQIFKDINLLFIFIFSLLSFFIPILFIQSGNPWNTIQFSYYGLYLTAVVSGAVLVYLVNKLHKLFSIFILSTVLILTPINSITTASYYTGNQPHALINNKELQALKFLSSQEQGVVLTYPYDQRLQRKLAEPWPLFVYGSTAYVSAFSNKPVYVEDESQNQILLTDYKKRLGASYDFVINPDNRARKKFLDSNNIKYIYLPKYFSVSIDEAPLNLKTIFENDEVKIYQRI